MTEPRVIVCGSRDWTDGRMIRDVIARTAEIHGRFTVVNGGARGADALAESAARSLGLSCHAELANWRGLGRGAGPERNARMLALAPFLVLAFKDDFLESMERGGTENMVKIARAAGVECALYGAGGLRWVKMGPGGTFRAKICAGPTSPSAP